MIRFLVGTVALLSMMTSTIAVQPLSMSGNQISASSHQASFSGARANGHDRGGLRAGRAGTNLFDTFHPVGDATTPREGEGAETSTDPRTMHKHNVSCVKMLKANFTVQDLEPVNFRANDLGTKQAFEADGFMAVTAQQAAIPCVGGAANTGSVSYPCSNIDLMSFVPLASMIIPGMATSAPMGNNIWGWTYQDGREFALMGLSTGVAFVEITNPANPVYIGILPAHNLVNSKWRDVRTYKNHAFVVSDFNPHGMQVFDLTLLLNVNVSTMPVRFTATAHYTGFTNAHTIEINEATGFAYAVGTNTFAGGLHIVNINNPTAPVFAGGYGGDGYTHECQCVLYDRGPDTRYIGREICFSYNEDTLTIVDVTNKAAPVQLSRRGYSGAKYTHQGWLTDDRRHVIVDDELDETGAEKSKSHIFNVQSLTNPTYVGFHSGTTTAIDHNQYIKGDLVFQANFLAGLQVLRINNLETASLTQVGYFDIFPSSDSNLFDGAWGNYPYFPSGNIIVSGMGQGLYVLKSPNNFGLTPTTPSLYTAPITNMALSDKVIRHYYLDVTAGQTVSCSTNGPNGDADLYLRFGSEAVPDTAFAGNACSSTSDASMESCSTVAASGSTRVYAAVHAWSAFSGLTFQCTKSTVSNNPTSAPPTSARPTTAAGTAKPTTRKPSTRKPTTRKPTTRKPTLVPTLEPTTESPTTNSPTTDSPTTNSPTTESPTTENPTTAPPTTDSPTTESPTTVQPTSRPTTRKPSTRKPSTRKPSTRKPSTRKPSTSKPIL